MASMIPVFGFGSREESAPPAIPWDSILKEEDRKEGETTENNAAQKLTQLHDKLIQSINQPEAKDFLTALVFLATRSNAKKPTLNSRQ